MADIVDSATRSRMMAGIRAKNTRPEMFLRKGLHALGFRFRLHVKNIPGTPDMVFPKYHAIIMVHGCFWHSHDCHYFKLPETNRKFWYCKIKRNRQRDKRNLDLLIKAGWRCLIVWECAIREGQKKRNKLDVVALVANWLAGSSKVATIDAKGIQE